MTHVCSEFQVGEDFHKLVEVFHHELEHSFICNFVDMLLRLSFLLILQLLDRLLHDSTPMLIIKADKDQLYLLKEASLDYWLGW